ncbi:MAG: hypothetical protein H7061_10625, partial [Bdellovibrionaceae bacterium]|nr:hypothetical protein [Bdellovibrio sp.]
MNNINKFIILSLAVTLVTSCNFKKSDRGQNEGAKETQLTIEDKKDAQKSIQPQELELNLATITKDLAHAQTASEIVSLLKSLESMAINSEALMNVRDIKSKPMLKALEAYNVALIKLTVLAPGSAELQNSMDSYEKMALASCTAQLRNCSNFSFLRTDQRSAEVLQLIVAQLDKKMDASCKTDCEADLVRYYNLLALSFDLSNSTRKTEAEFLYIKRASDYGKLFLKDETRNPDFFRKHGTVFASIVSEYPADPKSKRFADFVKTFKPWNHSRLETNAFPFGLEHMFSFAAKNYLYAANKIDLSAELRAAIDTSQASSDKSGPSFKMIIQSIKDHPRSASFFKGSNFDITVADKPDFYNEYFFMIDRLYRGHIGLEEAVSFWEGSKQDSKALFEVVNFYTKIEFLSRIILTNKYMTDIFNKPEMASETLFKQVIQQSEPLTKEWNKMFNKMENIALFVTRQLRNTRSSSKDFDEVQLMMN